ncbi:ski2-like helicase [Yersinia frederiksenii]|uniref:Ski2-like helicase n=1 Tax=Yersinia frederiksenii TaxID=29484 RepID=A0A380SDM9_YERFR|nr:DEAD/DEAH box helicase [Yersinia frederiksenii]SUQ39546.1 ski2-like helicase [Yersinia frederiksenii]
MQQRSLSILIQNILEPIEKALVDSLKYLAMGNLNDLIKSEPISESFIESEDLLKYATKALYYKLLVGVNKLAQELLSDNNNKESEKIFLDVMTLTKGVNIPIELNDIQAPISASLSGPHHLATLLLSISRDLPLCSVARVSPPNGIPKIAWNISLERMKLERPYLWKNHLDAIHKGFLNPGVSSSISFPTGAGKSTLSELKINTCLLLGRRVIFLAPTHSLVDQTKKFLENSFPIKTVGYGEFTDEEYSSNIPDILVLTPEGCLSLININPNLFLNIGLVVFDECHLLHTSSDSSRRAIDAMLCVLNLRYKAKNADFLFISAMMKNTEEIASWIRKLTDRECLSLDLSWKPTRQLRGSLVFEQKKLDQLQIELKKSKNRGLSTNPSTADKNALTIQPLALFSLKQTWETTKRKDYTLVKIFDDSINLSANNYWKLTPNSGSVSSLIACASAKTKIKTLVFFQTIKNAVSAANKISKNIGYTSVALNKHELKWLHNLEKEFGNTSHLYADIKDGKLLQAALPHHGLLMQEERFLFESLYKRIDGISAMTATSTIAQGMNLPSELVIIAEDSRFDATTDKREILAAQELLNAAGRAGRAGQNSIGIVLVIPGKVTGIELNISNVDTRWSELRKIFGQSDQCLVIDDPLEAVLDRVHDSINEVSDIDRYAILKMASLDENKEKGESLEWAVKSSLGAYRKRKIESNDSWERDRINNSISYMESQTQDLEDENIYGTISANTGLPFELIQKLSHDLALSDYNLDFSVVKWRNWLFDWLKNNYIFLDKIIREENIISLIGDKKYKSMAGDLCREKTVLKTIRKLTEMYTKGSEINKIEIEFGTPLAKLNKCEAARKFIIRIIPDLAYFFALPALIIKHKISEIDNIEEVPCVILELGKCIKNGFNNHIKSVMSSVLYESNLSRIHIHNLYREINDYLPSQDIREKRADTIKRVKYALEINSLF